MHDQRFIRERIAILEKELSEFLGPDGRRETSTGEGTTGKAVSAEDFIQAAGLDEHIENRHLVEFGPVQKTDALTIEFHTRPQPAFNRRFERLIADLESWESKKFGIYLFADNPKQLERLHTIFEDLKSAIRFTPVATSIHEGFLTRTENSLLYRS
jgi:transcription-repair coupling factor (superfamily II helicase)